MGTTLNPTSAAASSGLDKSLPVVNGGVTITSGSAPGSLLQEVLDAFNGGKPLQIAQAVKQVATDGVTITGTTSFLGEVQVQITAFFKPGGEFSLRLQFTALKLSSLVAPAGSLRLPGSFAMDLPTTWALIEQKGSNVTFTAAAQLGTLGEMAFVATHQGQWGVVAGLDLNVANLAAVPCLKGSPLATLDSFMGLTDFVVIASSLTAPTFNFPDLASFNATSVGYGKIVLPKQASGLVQGLNIYAQLKTTNSKGFQTLARYLKLKLDGTLGITLSVSLPDPESSSKLFLSVQEEIEKGLELDGELGVILQSGQVGAFLTGTAKTTIQGQPVTFTAMAVVLEAGVLIGGSMQNTVPVHFTIDGVKFELANVGLEIGIDDEGIPSFGFAATVDIGRFNASLALFIDSVSPANSMFAAAISDFTLLDVAECIAQQKDIPQPFNLVLQSIGLKGIKAFNLPITMAPLLDNRNLAAISTAFAAHGLTIPATSDKVLLDINTRGSLWYLTDLTTMHHYILRSLNNSVAVSYEPQLYCAPQATNIGGLQFPKGFHVDCVLDLSIIQAALQIEVTGLTGICADLDVDPIIIGNSTLFAITGFDGRGGPIVSLGTMNQPHQTDPRRQPPHLLISGEIKILGADLSSTYLDITPKGVIFDIRRQVFPFLLLDINGNIGDPHNMSIGGGAVIGINETLNLGPLGHVLLRADINGAITLGVKAGVAYARVQGGLQFEKWNLTLPTVELDVNAPALARIVETFVEHIVAAIVKVLLGDVTAWVNLVKTGVLTAVTEIGSVLKSEFRLAAHEASIVLHAAGIALTEIASTLKSVYGLAAKDAATILKDALNLGSDAINGALKAVGYAAHDVENALSDVFNWASSHLNPSKW